MSESTLRAAQQTLTLVKKSGSIPIDQLEISINNPVYKPLATLKYIFSKSEHVIFVSA